MAVVQNILILLLAISGAHSLVHYQKYPGDEKSQSCKTPGSNTKVGEYSQHKDYCGIIYCHTADGDALIHYCQIPATFEKCEDSGVNTAEDFPRCCWKCVKYITC
ncbi:uncharacterized protein LOC6592624 [Drosophila persimilis]|nr:uncharacterized protein LOC6592624 [Drosophila persimilis]